MSARSAPGEHNSTPELTTVADFKLQAMPNYRRKGTEELVRIAFVESEDYSEQAVELAKEILTERGVEAEGDLPSQAVESWAPTPSMSQERLASPLKVLCFVLPLVGVLIALVKRASNQKRASWDAWMMVGYGFVLRLVMGVAWRLLQLLSALPS